MKTALIFGVNGQDGSYLAELLVEKGYRVVGWMPQGAAASLENLSAVRDRITLTEGSLLEQASVTQTLTEYQPDEIYNLAAPSFAAGSWRDPVLVGEVAALGVARILEAVRQVCPAARFFQASTSELFGFPAEAPQNETTPFRPRNPYGVAKLYAHLTVGLYRENYGLFAAAAILYNHESPRRGREFVTRKIVDCAVKIKRGEADRLPLGNLDARRDWGYAGDYVEAMWRMLQTERPDDFVIGTGETHSVREICEIAFGELGLDYRDYVVQDPAFYRPSEPVLLVADPSKARAVLGWKPRTSFAETIRMMLRAACDR